VTTLDDLRVKIRGWSQRSKERKRVTVADTTDAV